VNFGRRWRVPKLVLAIPGSAEFLARAPGVWQKRTAIIKARFPSPLPLLNPPSLPLPCHSLSRSRALALSRSLALSLSRSLALSTVHFPCRVASRRVASRRVSPRFASLRLVLLPCARSLVFVRSLGPASPGGGVPSFDRRSFRIGKGKPLARKREGRTEKIGRADDGGWSSGYRSRQHRGPRERPESTWI